MRLPERLEVVQGICEFRPHGECSLVEAVDLIGSAIEYCRHRRIVKLLVNGTGLVGMSVPNLIDRFLMVEEWAHKASGFVVVVLVVDARYIHPEKIGVKVATDIGLMCDVYDSEPNALEWLSSATPPARWASLSRPCCNACRCSPSLSRPTTKSICLGRRCSHCMRRPGAWPSLMNWWSSMMHRRIEQRSLPGAMALCSSASPIARLPRLGIRVHELRAANGSSSWT